MGKIKQYLIMAVVVVGVMAVVFRVQKLKQVVMG
jgi:hypothetical protein